MTNRMMRYSAGNQRFRLKGQRPQNTENPGLDLIKPEALVGCSIYGLDVSEHIVELLDSAEASEFANTFKR